MKSLPENMAKVTMSLFSFPVLTKTDVMVLSFLLVFASGLVVYTSGSKTDEYCIKYCGKTCWSLPSAERDVCNISHENCDCSSTPPRAASGAKGRSSYSKNCHTDSSGARVCEETSSSGDLTIFIVIGVIGSLCVCACIGVCIYFSVRSSRSNRGAGAVAPYGGGVAPYGGGGAVYGAPVAYGGQPQMYGGYQPAPSQPVESGAVGSNYGAATY